MMFRNKAVSSANCCGTELCFPLFRDAAAIAQPVLTGPHWGEPILCQRPTGARALTIPNQGFSAYTRVEQEFSHHRFWFGV